MCWLLIACGAISLCFDLSVPLLYSSLPFLTALATHKDCSQATRQCQYARKDEAICDCIIGKDVDGREDGSLSSVYVTSPLVKTTAKQQDNVRMMEKVSSM